MEEISVILAERPGLGHVQLCGCNSIHLTIGPVTVTLAPDAFAQTAALIHNAMEQLTEIMEARQGYDPFGPAPSTHSALTH